MRKAIKWAVVLVMFGSCGVAVVNARQERQESWERLTTPTTQWYQHGRQMPEQCPNSNAWRCWPQPDGSIIKTEYCRGPAGGEFCRGGGDGYEVIWPSDVTTTTGGY